MMMVTDWYTHAFKYCKEHNKSLKCLIANNLTTLTFEIIFMDTLTLYVFRIYIFVFNICIIYMAYVLIFVSWFKTIYNCFYVLYYIIWCLFWLYFVLFWISYSFKGFHSWIIVKGWIFDHLIPYFFLWRTMS